MSFTILSVQPNSGHTTSMRMQTETFPSTLRSYIWTICSGCEKEVSKHMGCCYLSAQKVAKDRVMKFFLGKKTTRQNCEARKDAKAIDSNGFSTPTEFNNKFRLPKKTDRILAWTLKPEEGIANKFIVTFPLNHSNLKIKPICLT